MTERNKSFRNYYQRFSRTLAPNEVAFIQTYGNHLTLLSNSASFDIELSLDGNTFSRFPAGLSLTIPNGLTYEKIWLKNPDGAASTTVVLAIANGVIENNQVSFAGEINSNPASNVVESPAAIAPTTTAGAISLAADTAQREVILYNSGTTTVWIGDSNVDGSTNRGIPLFPNEKIIISNEAEIFFHSISGTGSISVLRCKR